MQEKAEPFGSAFVRFYNILILYLNRLTGVERIRNRVGNEGCLGAVVNGQLGLRSFWMQSMKSTISSR